MLEAAIGVLGAAMLGVIGWAFSLSNRVAVLEADKESLQKLIDTRMASMSELIKEKLEGMAYRLARIEAKLDHEN